MLFLKFIRTKYKENIATDRFISAFRGWTCSICMELYGVRPRHHINFLSFLLQVWLWLVNEQSPSLRSSYLKLQTDIFFMQNWIYNWTLSNITYDWKFFGGKLVSLPKCISQFQAWPSPRATFLMGKFLTPWAKRKFKTPTPGPIKTR